MTGVLIIDDEQVVCEMLAQVLEEPARRVRMAHSCEQARAALELGGYHVALVDKNLPDGSGLELARSIKARDPMTEVLIITAYPSMASAVEAVEVGASGYVVKPFEDVSNVALMVTSAEEKSVMRRERDGLDRALRESEERYHKLFDATPDAVVAFDERSRCVRAANKAAVRLYGYPDGTLIGKPIDAILGSPVSEGAQEAAASDRVPASLVFRRDKRADGTRIEVEAASARFSLRGEEMCLEVVRDVSERIRQEALRSRLQDELRQAQKLQSLGQLAGGVAHDFNNLITVMECFCAFLTESLEQIPDAAIREEATADLEQIRRATESAASITKQLLAFSRKEVVRPESLSLNTIVQRLSSILRASLGGKVTLETHLAPGLWDVKLDATQVEQALINLAINGRDAMPEGGKLSVETRNLETPATSSQDATRWVVVSVRDTGVGIREDLRDKIFDPFFTTKGGKGTGLGLASVMGIVEAAGGTVEVSSVVGEGTEFRLILPATDEPRAVSSPPAPVVRVDAATRGVLLVEDDDAVRRALCRILARTGYQVMEARTGEEALALFQQAPSAVDALLIDIVLPGISGEELARRIRSTAPGLPLVFFTGYATRESVVEAPEFKDVPLLPKPFREQRLLEALGAVLAARD